MAGRPVRIPLAVEGDSAAHSRLCLRVSGREMYPIDARLVIQVKCVFVGPAGEYVGTDFQVKETPRG